MTRHSFEVAAGTTTRDAEALTTHLAICYLASFVNRVKNSQLSWKVDFTMNCLQIITII